MSIRIVSAVVLAPIVLGCAYLGGAWFQGLVLAGLLVALVEWFRLCRNWTISVGERLMWLGFGGLYIIVSCIALGLLRGDDVTGRNTVFFVLGVVWVADSGAYIFGCLIGGPKLAPRISPKKTWAGFVGALVSSGIAGSLFFSVLPDHSVMELCLVAVVMGGVAQIGDLAESLAKRRFDVKDSGSLIPGHGGILDRIDGLMAASLLVGLVVGVIPGGLGSWF